MLHIGEPVAFLRAQRGWQAENGTGWFGWISLFIDELALREGASTAFFAVTKILIFFGGVMFCGRCDRNYPALP